MKWTTFSDRDKLLLIIKVTFKLKMIIFCTVSCLQTAELRRPANFCKYLQFAATECTQNSRAILVLPVNRISDLLNIQHIFANSGDFSREG